MHIDHQHYEELSALVVSGQASETEFLEYADHAETCADCRSLRTDFDSIAQVVTASDGVQAPRHDMPVGMTERFVARARAEGVPLSPYSPPIKSPVRWFQLESPVRWLQPRFLAAAVVLVALFSMFLFLFGMRGAEQNNKSVAHLSPLPPVSPTAESPKLGEENARLARRLRDTQLQADQLVGVLERKRKDLDAAQNKTAELNGRIENLQRLLDGLQRDRADKTKEIAQLQDALKTAVADKENYRLEAVVQKGDLLALRSKLDSLNQHLESQSRQLEEAQQLSAAANQAKDLIIARNLHIVDVHDNENGSKPRPFGRIFYTEGKRLVFYAYDLGDPTKLSAKVSFYVWGEKSGTSQQVKNLGIFRADDAHDGRWVLTFDDPRVLAQVNTIFVTSESNNKKVTKPNGNRILTAFLDDVPNHP